MLPATTGKAYREFALVFSPRALNVPRRVRPLQTLRLADFMLKKTMGFSASNERGSTANTWSPVPVTPPRPLDLALSPASLRAIASAEVAFDNLVDGHEVSYCMGSSVCVC